MRFATLWQKPEINPDTKKALTLPVLRPWDRYGRCFHLSWLGFFVAFLSWFAFPPLQASIKKDLKLTPADVSNSNVVGLTATMVARFALGPLCDLIGPRYTMAFTLLVGAIPTAFVPLVKNKEGLFAIRFFVGLLGGTFVPCQMWTTSFFDTAVVGRANALAGGWGNAGGGVAYFTMPAVETSLLNRGFGDSRSWKFAFLVCPFILIVFIAILILLFGYDCPEGKWSERTVGRRLVKSTASTPGIFTPDVASPSRASLDEKKGGVTEVVSETDLEMSQAIEELEEFIEKPTFGDVMKVAFHPRTMLTALPYATTFGGELAVESILSAFYLAHSKKLGENWTQQLAGNWGSMMGLMNIFTRPLGGYISDLLYQKYQTTLVKKYWMLTCGILQSIFLLWIGLDTGITVAGLIVGVAFMSVFMEAGNGANFSLVPHINPHHSGIVAGITGGFGNIGGILFSLAFRFSVTATGATDYQKGIWEIAIAMLLVNVLCALIPLSPNDFVKKLRR